MAIQIFCQLFCVRNIIKEETQYQKYITIHQNLGQKKKNTLASEVFDSSKMPLLNLYKNMKFQSQRCFEWTWATFRGERFPAYTARSAACRRHSPCPVVMLLCLRAES